MNNKITILSKKSFLAILFLFFIAPTFLNAQTITNVINGKPGNLVTERCYNPASDPQPPNPPNPFKYFATFSFSGFPPGFNSFTLQFSNASGSFATPTFLSSTPVITGSTGQFEYVLPAGTSGTGYRMRVIKTGDPSISGISAAIPSYYIPFLGTFYLLENRVSTVSICGGGSFNLFVSPNSTLDPTPAVFPGLKYKWVRNGVIISGETGTSINITQSGVYYAYLDYGSCNPPIGGGKPATSSIDVTVNIVPGGSAFIISGSNTICPPIANPLSVTAGYAYQWFKNGVAIPGETAFTYNALQPGEYTVLVNQGTCSSTSPVFNVTVPGFTASIDVDLQPDTNVIGTGETKSITITSNATTPTYEWYLFDGTNYVLIPSAISAIYNATQAGKYKGVVNQTTGCLVSQDFLFELKEGVNPKEIPNLISPNTDGKNDTWILPSEYGNANTEVQIVSASGKVVLQTKNYLNDWPTSEIDFKSVNPVYYYTITKDGGDVKKGSITIIK